MLDEITKSFAKKEPITKDASFACKNIIRLRPILFIKERGNVK